MMISNAANVQRRETTRSWCPRRLMAAPLLLIALGGCGAKKNNTSKSQELASPGEKAFYMAEEVHHVPSRLLMAVGYLESRLSAPGASALYKCFLKGPALGETAFGLSREELELSAPGVSDDLSAQIDAYARWLAAKVAPGMPPKPSSNDEKFLWIWEIAQLHRSKTNTRILFTQELMEVLNGGFTWLDPKSQSVVEVKPEQPAITIASLQASVQKRLLLETRRAEVAGARMALMRGDYLEQVEQRPRGIEVIHCPFTLSACLELQVQENPAAPFWMGAHYVIPQDERLVDVPLQVAVQDDAVPMLAADGSKTMSQDKVIIMLAGYSGRLVAGKRQDVNPAWISKWQLKRLGELILDVCDRMAHFALQDGEGVDVEQCKKVGKGTHFRFSGKEQSFQWGDIVDYDPLLFRSYVDQPDGLTGQTAFDFPGGKRSFVAGDDIHLNLSFDGRAEHVQLERMVRCPNGQVRWETVANKVLRQQASYAFTEKYWDAGPNGNGHQFFRAKVYGIDWELRGWDLTTILLSNYETDAAMAPRNCQP